jgi:hypothetical protein
MTDRTEARGLRAALAEDVKALIDRSPTGTYKLTAPDGDDIGLDTNALLEVLRALSAPTGGAPAGLVVSPLEWSKDAGPNSGCHYTHTQAETPFGRMLITWKGWKDYPSFALDESPFGPRSLSSSTADAAREEAEAIYREAVLAALASAPSHPSEAPQAQPAAAVQSARERRLSAAMARIDAGGPLPGMIAAFESNFAQSWTDPEWSHETSLWAAAWRAGSADSRKALDRLYRWAKVQFNRAGPVEVSGDHPLALAEAALTPHPTGEPQAQPEPVGEVLFDKNFGCKAGQLFEDLPLGTKLYATPPSQAEAQVDAERLDWAQENLVHLHQDIGEAFSITYLNGDGGHHVARGEDFRAAIDAARAKDKTQ